MKSSIFRTIPPTSVSLAFALLALATANAPGQTQPCIETNGIKFFAGPQVNGGLDVKDSRNSIVLADDFLCTNSGPITDIHIWGSWLANQHGTITNFWIGIYSDVPQSINGTTIVPSHPGNLLWYQDFGTSYSESPYATGTEFFYNPTNNGNLGTDNQAWYYCFFPTNPFPQQGSINNPTNYWLAIHAQIADPVTLFGWKSTTNLYNDAAVWGTLVGGFPNGIWQNMTNPLTQQRLNLSMMLTTPTNTPPQTCCPDTNGIKWVQGPDLLSGIDYDASQPYILADDFKCTNSGPITDIHLWGSWLFNNVDYGATYTLAIWSDVPVGPGNTFSQPGTLLWSQVFAPPNYTICLYTNVLEPWNAPDSGPVGSSTNLYYLCFFPDAANTFTQGGSQNMPTNYWLSVTVQPSAAGGGYPFGWKSSSITYNDSAVYSTLPFPPPAGTWNPVNPGSPGKDRVDLAFKITTATNCIVPITCPVDTKTVPCGAAWSFDPPIVGPDPCCPQPPLLVLTVITNSTTVPCNQSYTGIWTVISYCSGSVLGVCTQNVTVLDTNPPVMFNCITQKTVECGTTWTFDQPTAQYLCSGSNVLVGILSSNINPTVLCSGVVGTIVWSATNECSGAYSTCTQTVSIVDTNPPVITCTSNKTVVAGTPWTFDPPTAIDACCGTNVTILILNTFTNGTGCTQLVSRVWQAVDCCNNFSDTCTQTVTVVCPQTGCCPDTNGVKWVQLPDLISGIDYNATQPFILADDFKCTTRGPITDIHLWGSWLSDQVDLGATYTLAIWSDAPTNVDRPFSHPGNLLWSQVFPPGNYTICPYTNVAEPFYVPGATVAQGSSTNLFYLCFFPDPASAFTQAGAPNQPTNYWLSVTVTPSIPTAPIYFGWKSSTNHYNDTAVQTTVAFPPPTGAWNPFFDPQGGHVDLAFKITTATNNQPPPVVCVESDFDKYVQGPNLIGGFDVWNTPYLLADDFLCTNTGPVSDIHLWGSWLNDAAQTNTIIFWLGIYDDVPVGTGNTFSHPGTNLLWQQWFVPGQYAETIWSVNAFEQFLDPGQTNNLGGDSVVWYYCFYPTNAFQQTGSLTNSKTYWLAAYAQLPVGGNFNYGWKTATNVLKDTSVHAIWPGSPPIGNPGWTPTAGQPPAGGPAVPLDLAFKITMCGPVMIKWLPPTNVMVTWPGAGYLQSATNVSGPYLDVPGFPTSPYIDYSVTPTNKFYRLRCY